MASVALKNVTKVFPGGVVALDNVSLDVAEGEFMVLLGPSGCGKSTLLRIVAGLEEPTSGTVLLDDVPVDDLPPRKRGVAMVFQNYALYPHMSVGGNVEFPLRVVGKELAERQRSTSDAAAALRIGDLLDRRIGSLSGGQRQRVAIGRAIVREPNLFLLDEPLSNLDARQRTEMRAEISGLAKQLGVTVLYVTHDQTEALTMADRVAIMHRGAVQDVGTSSAVYNQPATTYVAAFLGSPHMTLVEGEVWAFEDSHIDVVLGEETLQLPWSHSQTRILSRYHAEKIIVGMRAEAFTPVASGTGGNVLSGAIRTLEHHGHETLVFVDMGVTEADVEDTGPYQPYSGPGRRGPLSGFLSRLARWTGSAELGDDDGQVVAPPEPGRHHRRRADVAVRLAPYPGIATGDRLSLAVDVEALHFFGMHGKRIDAGWRSSV